MPANQRIQLTQRQQLGQTLAPLQVQFFRLLELNEAALEQEVDRQLNDNPALEAIEPAPDEHTELQEEEFNETADQLMRADYRSPDDIPHLAPNKRGTVDITQFAGENTSPTLFDVLHAQLATGAIDPDDLPVYDTIIGTLDSNGYMTRSSTDLLTDISVINNRPDITPVRLREMLATVRNLDPPGVGAADLRQCLLLQLKRRDADNPGVADAIEIITHYFDLFSLNNLKRLQADSGLDSEALKRAYAVIHTLNPKPGAAYSGNSELEDSTMTTADFVVDVDSSGHITVKIASSIPELAIEASFAEPTFPKAANPADAKRLRAAKAFVKHQRDEAANFITIVRTRQETLLRVMQAIVALQRDYFLGGGDAEMLRPMVLRDVAAATGYDISVVSRATSTKNVRTPWGLIPLRDLFGEQVGDEGVSRRGVMERLRRMIASEDPLNPFTDDQLTSMLNSEGFALARRTVAKHRRQLGLPVARLRRRL